MLFRKSRLAIFITAATDFFAKPVGDCLVADCYEITGSLGCFHRLPEDHRGGVAFRRAFSRVQLYPVTAARFRLF
jgi:hypothetical protein